MEKKSRVRITDVYGHKFILCPNDILVAKQYEEGATFGVFLTCFDDNDAKQAIYCTFKSAGDRETFLRDLFDHASFQELPKKEET